MSIYDDLKPVAAEVLGEFKQGTVKLISLTPADDGTVDEPGDPTETETELDATVRGAPYKYVQNGFAVASDLMVTAAPVAGVTPQPSDFIEIDSIRYKIMQIIPLPAAGVQLVWKFIVRKGG